MFNNEQSDLENKKKELILLVNSIKSQYTVEYILNFVKLYLDKWES